MQHNTDWSTLKKFLVIIIIASFFARPVHAATTSSSISISDAVYADLALRHYLENVSVYYDDGKQTNKVTLNETRHWLPASTVKVFAAMYAYKRIQDGKLHLNDLVTIAPKNEVTTELVTNELPTLLSGDTVTVDRLIRQMITQSDNTAYNQLLDLLGRDSVTTYIQSLGLVHSHVGSKLNLDTSQEQYEFDVPGYGINTTTAEDYAKAFLLVKKNKLPGAKQLYEVLKAQKINNMIPLFLPSTIICAHKTGDLDPLYHDGGICQNSKKSYVLTIFTNAGDPNLIAHLSELMYTANYNLVGGALQKSPVSQIQSHPLDPLVMGNLHPSVLGSSTQPSELPQQPITASDLGVTASDLSLVIKDQNLPSVIIPADSQLHNLSDLLFVAKKLVAPTTQAKHAADLDLARLRLAEVEELLKRGKTQEAQQLLNSIQQGLSSMVKDPTIQEDSAAQNNIQAISETRFSILGGQLQKAKGEQKIALIKEVATQAKETLQKIQPNIPDATNASNPSQKPLVGEIVNRTSDSITVKTAGGQDVTVSTKDTPVVVKNQPQQLPLLSPTESVGPTPSVSMSPLPNDKLEVGTTVALVGSSTHNSFSPTLILSNIPKELVAPVPVTVAKVDVTHNTMVVIENDVYTQVNINHDTSIKGADTDIPLKEIKPGDVVVVRGEPLTPIIPPPSVNPSLTSAPNLSNTVVPEKVVTPTGNSQPTTSQPKSVLSRVPTKALSPTGNVGTAPTGDNTPHPTTVRLVNPPTTIPKQSTQPSPSSQPTQAQPTPKVIQSTSIQLLQQKPSNAPPPPENSAQASQKPSQPPSKSSSPPPPPQPQQNQQQSGSLPAQPPKTDDKKK